MLRKAKDRAHILEGLRIALDNLDRVIALIRGSADVEQAREGLMREFGLSEKQAQAILDMRLQRLTALERQKLQEEYRSLMEEIAFLEALLADERLVMKEIKRELKEIEEKYGDQRRTMIVPDEGEIDLEDLIVEEKMVITLTQQGYVKRQPLNTYRSQGRGGRGVLGHSTRETDFIVQLFVSSTRTKLLFFSNTGKVYPLKVYEIPEAGRQARGTAIINLLPLDSGEYITAVFPLAEYDEEDHIILATQNGLIKRTQLREYAEARRSGLIAIDLTAGDELISVKRLIVDKDTGIESENNAENAKGVFDEAADVLLATSGGLLIRFPVSQLRTLGRTARGVKGITLLEDEKVIGMSVVTGDNAVLLFVTENGFGKRTRLSEFRSQNRGGRGVLAFKPSKRSGAMVSFMPVQKKEELIAITARGLIIRAKVSQIPIQKRYAGGVTLMRLTPEDKVVNVAVVARE